jgi:tRNA(Ile2) C34 agmatinyltransferase TiaS
MTGKRMHIYLGFDDTDNLGASQGTGKLARWFERELPVGCRLTGVVRQQLLVNELIPYTSHNSSACAIVLAPDSSAINTLIARAAAHVESHSLEGSDPGLCAAWGENGALLGLTAFGRRCTRELVTQREAMEAASGFHLSGHGGTNGGIIGAAAAVGLTASGWSGRFIEYGRLRDFPAVVRVSELERARMKVTSIDRDAAIPAPEDTVYTRNWLRPRLWAGQAVVLVAPRGPGEWDSLGEKRGKGTD